MQGRTKLLTVAIFLMTTPFTAFAQSEGAPGGTVLFSLVGKFSAGLEDALESSTVCFAMRISVSNWSTRESDVELSLQAIIRAARAAH